MNLIEIITHNALCWSNGVQSAQTKPFLYFLPTPRHFLHSAPDRGAMRLKRMLIVQSGLSHSISACSPAPSVHIQLKCPG